MKNILKKILLLSLLFIVSCSTSEELCMCSPSPPPDIKPILEKYQKEIKTGGIFVSYQKESHDIINETVGFSHEKVNEKVKLTPDMLFAAASNTKTFTAVLIMLLKEQNKLKLSDTIDKFITKSYKNIDPKITISQLLNHSSGLADFVDQTLVTKILLNPSKNYTVDEILAKVPVKTSNAGTKFAYSSTNYILLGMIIEKISGKTYLEYLKENIIQKLSMKHTFLEGKEPVKGTWAHNYFLNGDNINDVTIMNRSGLASIAWSAGALVMKPSEMITFYRALFEGKLVSKESLEQMKTPIKNPEYGYGLQKINQKINKGDFTFYGHGGQTVAFESLVAYEPNTKIILCIYVNSASLKPKGELLRNLATEIFLKIK